MMLQGILRGLKAFWFREHNLTWFLIMLKGIIYNNKIITENSSRSLLFSLFDFRLVLVLTSVFLNWSAWPAPQTLRTLFWFQIFHHSLMSSSTTFLAVSVIVSMIMRNLFFFLQPKQILMVIRLFCCFSSLVFLSRTMYGTICLCWISHITRYCVHKYSSQ